MPLLALEKFRLHISKKYFYAFGIKNATNALIILFTSLLSICIISYPFILDYTYPRSQSTDNFIDAHLWQFSRHVHVTTNNSHPADFIAQQIHVSANDQTLSKPLLKSTLSIYNTITTSRITTIDGSQTISLEDICAQTPYGTCIVHLPIAYWNNDLDRVEQDHDIFATINKYMHKNEKMTQISLHPYSTMGNVKLDSHGNLQSAESLIITFILRNTSSSLEIWNQLYEHAIYQLEDEEIITQKQLNAQSCILQFKLRILPTPSTQVVTVSLVAIGLFFIIRNHLGKSNLIKSRSGLAMTTLFLSLACYSGTMGIFQQFFFHKQIHVIPWFLQILVCTTANLEHSLLLTGAVISREKKEISVKERIASGLEQVGISMTTTLIGELIVLSIGSAMKENNVKSFCIFASVALITAYILNLTLFTAVLSIDIKRAELTDLGNNDDLKGTPEDSSHNQDSYYGRGFKTRRALNALFLCLILISLSVFPSKNPANISPHAQIDKAKYTQLALISDQFWTLINPSYTTQYLQIQPPYAVILSNNNDTASTNKQMNRLNSLYSNKLSILNKSIADDDGRFNLSDLIQPYLLFLFSINVPNVLLLFILIGIMMWMIPYLREKFLIPIIRMIYVRTFTCVLRIISKTTPIKTDSLIRRVEYNEDGVHIGAILLQSEYNKLQNQNSLRNVHIHTLAGAHIADIRQLDVSKESGMVVSTGEDGKIVLWKGDNWTARLDRLDRLGGGLNGWIAEKNPKYHGGGGVCNNKSNVKKSDYKCLSRSRSVRISDDGKWAIAGFEDGMIRVWNASTVHLVRELSVHKAVAANTPPGGVNHTHGGNRVIQLVFLDEKVRADIVEPEVKKKNVLKLSLRHFILSIHKDGTMREWNLKTGEMIHCIKSGHIKEITAVYVLPNNQQAERSSKYFVFTASEDGMIKCWERSMDHDITDWQCKYSISDADGGHSSITNLAAQQMNNGMGILVTGSSGGAVKVWNLHTGDVICTLSKGGIIKKNPEAQVEGGPLLQFSKVARRTDDNTKTAYLHKEEHSVSNHHDSISQVVVSPISNPEFDNDTCPTCNTIINSGFFVASCSLDETVHVWRLDRAGIGKDVGCTICRKEYHPQQQYMRRGTTPIAPLLSSLRSQQRKMYYASSNNASGDEGDSGVSIGGTTATVSFDPLYLGKLHQYAGRGLVFCRNMVLAGARRHYAPSQSMNLFASLEQQQNDKECEWEAWFTSLQYYEPPSLAAAEDTLLIPVITFDLEKEGDDNLEQSMVEKENPDASRLSLWNSFLLHVFGVKKKAARSNINAANNPSSAIHHDSSRRRDISDNDMSENEFDGSESSTEEDRDDEYKEDDDDDEESYDILPFSTIRHVVPTNGFGLGCDYGNFIKIVSFDDQQKK